MKNPDIIENLLVADAMIKDMPSRAFDLNQFANEKLLKSGGHACGSVGCFGGWVAVHPYFQSLGVSQNPTGVPVMKRARGSVAKKLFNNPTMFLGKSNSLMSDKQEILERIKNALYNETS